MSDGPHPNVGFNRVYAMRPTDGPDYHVLAAVEKPEVNLAILGTAKTGVGKMEPCFRHCPFLQASGV
jgi:hypothetical protein